MNNNDKKRAFVSIILSMLFTFSIQAQQTTHLEGRVYLNDTLPAAYATLYLPQYSIGTVTDDQGRYQLDGIPVGSSVVLEYAYLGYRTEQIKVNLSQPGHRYAHDHHLKEQAIQLSEVYLTPNGEDPCVYIFRKVHEQGQINRKRLINYQAVCDGSFHVQDLDVPIAFLPGFASKILHGVLRTYGINALFNYVSGHEKVDVNYRYTQTWKKGKVKNSGMSILSANPAMTSQEQRQLGKFQDDNFFELFYGKNKKFNAQKVTQQGWTLKGVIEENGLTIDVLSRIDNDSTMNINENGVSIRISSDDEAEIYKCEYTIYIIEDLWSVLRYEERSPRNIKRFECHDIGGGIYLPVLYVTNPMPLNLDKIVKEIKEDYEKSKAEGSASKMEKKMIERYEKTINGRTSVNINFVTPYSIKYSGVEIKK